MAIWTDENEQDYQDLFTRYEIEDALSNLETFSPADKLLQDIPEPYFAMPEVTRPAGLIEFVERWHDPEFRKSYLNLKEDIGGEYMVGPASYAGFIEESPELYEDVSSAAKETGVDPEFLYNVTMQEGLAQKMSILHKSNIDTQAYLKEVGGKPIKNTSLYESSRALNTFKDIGLDTIFEDQDRALARGYLGSRIQPDPNMSVMSNTGKKDPETGDIIWEEGEYGTVLNEAGLKVQHAFVSSKDAIRGVGALIRLNKDYLQGSFEEEGIDFDVLPEKQQNFWMYAAFNAGAGNAAKLLETYGAEPYSNPKFVEKLRKGQADSKAGLHTQPLVKWMENVGRVVGGTEITDLYKPWDDDLVYGDLKE